MLVNIPEEHAFRGLQAAVTLCKFDLVDFGILRDVRVSAGLVHLFENKVVCAVIFANDGHQAAVLVVADMQVTDG